MKEELKIRFRNEEMSIKDANRYRRRLRFGLEEVNLWPEEERDYELKNKLRESKKERKISKKRYLIDKIKELENKVYCEKHGHKELRDSAYTPLGSSVTHYICARCWAVYTKKSNPDIDD